MKHFQTENLSAGQSEAWLFCVLKDSSYLLQYHVSNIEIPEEGEVIPAEDDCALWVIREFFTCSEMRAASNSTSSRYWNSFKFRTTSAQYRVKWRHTPSEMTPYQVIWTTTMYLWMRRAMAWEREKRRRVFWAFIRPAYSAPAASVVTAALMLPDNRIQTEYWKITICFNKTCSSVCHNRDYFETCLLGVGVTPPPPRPPLSVYSVLT